MVENKDANRSLLLPKWHSIEKIGSVDYSSLEKSDQIIPKVVIDDFAKEYDDFIKDKNITKACALLHSGIMLGQKDKLRDVIEYVLISKHRTSSLASLGRILKGENENTFGSEASERISKIRKTLSYQNRNALLWIELARQYTVKGLLEKAERCVNTAISLAPNNRYIVRASARFYIHTGDIDIAQRLCKKALEETNDPWIKSTAINCSILNDMHIKGISITDTETVDVNKLFHYSELLSSSAMLDIRVGNEKRAKRLLKLAWKDPTEIVLANAEWIIRNKFPALGSEAELDFSSSVEALTWEKYLDLDIDHALENAILWGLEEPYSTHPFTCGSGIACLSHNYDNAIRIALEGLTANPNDVMLKNNLAFSYLRCGRLSEAKKVFEGISRQIREDDLCYLTATIGLYYYMIGNIEFGRKLYQRAYTISEIQDDKITSVKVLLNNAIAEELNAVDKDNAISKKALSVSKDIIDPGIILLRNDLTKIVHSSE